MGITVIPDFEIGPPGEPVDVDASDVTYTPADDTDWDAETDPGNVDAALDQLATRMTAVEESPGGDPGEVDASDVTYTPADDTDWDAETDPGNVDAALDQLAERMTAVEESPGGVGDLTTPEETTDEALVTWDGTDGSAVHDNPDWRIHQTSGKLRTKCRYIPESPVVSGSAPELDWNLTDNQRIFLTGNAAPVIVNATKNQFVWVRVRQDGDGGHTLDWSNAVTRWASGINHTMTPTADREDSVMLHCEGLDQYGNPVITGYIISQNTPVILEWDYEPPPPIIYDSFTGSNGTALNGRSPDIGSGTWSGDGHEIQSNRAQSLAAGSFNNYIDAGVASYRLSAKVYSPSAHAAVLLFRSDGSGANNWAAYFLSGVLYLARRVSSSDTVVDSTSCSGFTSGDTMVVLVNGNNVTVTLSGEEITADISSHHTSNTYVGLRAPVATVSFDDFLVEALS